MTIDPALLDRGEVVLWSGNPNALKYAFKRSWYTFLFGAFFFGFSVFWIYGATKQSGGTFGLFGVPFVVVGAALVLSPLWHLFRGMHAAYVLTSERAITIYSGTFGNRISVPLSAVGFIDVHPSADGSGDIYFKETAVEGSKGTTISRDGFLAIADVNQVERLLRKAIGKRTQ